MYSEISRMGLSPRFILPMKNMLRLQRTPETFHGRVVVAVALATHGGSHPELLEQIPERIGTVLAAGLLAATARKRDWLTRCFVMRGAMA